MNLVADVYGAASRYLDKAKLGGPEELAAICPFHRKADGSPERGASFSMNIVTGLWFCHSCHERGNFRSFLKRLGAPSFHVDVLYKPLLETLDAQSWKDKKKAQLFHVDLNQEPIPESVLGLFDFCPVNLLEEGFEEATLRTFDVGYDQRNERVTYPIRDLAGRLVGFSGRAEDERLPKYKIYSEKEYRQWELPTRKTEKSWYIWNLDRLYQEISISSKTELILVEGFKACMWLWQMGYKNTVALMGSYLSVEQKTLLQRLGSHIYLFLDNDGAGHRGYNFMSKALSTSLDVSIVTYEGHQPTDLTPTEVHNAIAMAPDYFTWVLQGA